MVSSSRASDSPRHLGQAEVEDLHLPALVDEDVLGLDVAMNDTLGMGFVQRVGDLDSQFDDPGRLQRPVPDELRQRLPVDILHGDVADAAFLAHVVDVRDVGMGEGGGSPRFAREPLGKARVFRPGRKDLERHPPLQPGVVGEVDLAHPALPKTPDDAVVGQRFEGHIGGVAADPTLPPARRSRTAARGQLHFNPVIVSMAASRAGAPAPVVVAPTKAASRAGKTTIRAKNVPPLPSAALSMPSGSGTTPQP